MRQPQRPNPATEKRIGEVFDYIVAFKTANDGVSPSIRDIVVNVGISSTSMATYYLRKLEQRGKIKRHAGDKSLSRAIIVPGGRWAFSPEPVAE